jgi:uncharacterized membrane protein
MKLIARSFFEGLLILVPVLISVYVVYTIFVNIDGLLGIPIPGVGFVITLFVITLVGFLASNYVTGRIFDYFDGLFARLPFVKILYTAVKDLLNAFVGEKKGFDKPVLVNLTDDGKVKTVGFITRESLKSFGIARHVAVYLPQSYNFAGHLVIVPRKMVKPLDIESSEAMAFIISGGVAGGKK